MTHYFTNKINKHRYLILCLLFLTGIGLQAQNLARNGTATQSSTATGFPASNVNDGNLGTISHTNAATTTDWLVIDLGASYPLGKLRIFNRIDCCADRLANVYVMVSNNPFPTALASSLTNSLYTYQFPSNTSSVSSQDLFVGGLTARYIKVQKSGVGNVTNWLHLREIAVELDTDGDGITDATDVDDDNDGILDADEGLSTIDLRTGTSFVNTSDPIWSVSWVTPTQAEVNALTTDPTYRDLANYTTPTGTFPTAAYVTGNLAPGSWVNAPSGTNWISHNFTGTNNGPGNHTDADVDGRTNEPLGSFSRVGTGDFVFLKFRTTVNIPTGTNLTGFSVALDATVDNVAGVYVNGVLNSPIPSFFGNITTVNLNSGWQIGANIIEVQVSSGPGLVGFAASGFRQLTQDFDGDGVPNHLDSDSDNDGCPDAIEGAGSIVVSQLASSTRISGTSASNGLPTLLSGTAQGVGSSQNASVVVCCDAAASGNLDTDGDNISNTCDLDDDNDGILDTNEGAFSVDLRTGTTAVGTSDPKWNVSWVSPTQAEVNRFNSVTSISPNHFDLTNYAAPVGTFPVSALVTGNLIRGGWLDAPLGSDWISYNFPGTNNGPGIHSDADGDGRLTEPDQSSRIGTGDYVFLKYTATVNIPSGTNLNGLSLQLNTVTDNYSAFYVNGTFNGPIGFNFKQTTPINLSSGWQIGSNTIEVHVISGPSHVGFAAIGISQITRDTDGDGTPDHLDADSDNDGCADVIEGGANFVEGASYITNNRLNTTVNSSGMAAVPSGTSGYSQTTGQTVANSIVATQVTLITPPSNQFVVAPLTDSFFIKTQASNSTTWSGLPGARVPVYGSLGNADTGMRYKWYLGHPDTSGVALVNGTSYSGVTNDTFIILNTLGLNGNRYCVEVTQTNNACVREIRCANLNYNESNPDVNATYINTSVSGSVKTNDKVVAGTTYGTSPTLVSGPSGGSVSTTLSMNSDGTYTFVTNTPGTYIYNVPVCPPSVTPPSCPTEPLTITVLENTVNHQAPIANVDIGSGMQGNPVTLKTLLNDQAGNSRITLDSTTVSIVSGTPNAATQGSLSVNPTTGDVTFTPVAGFTGTISWQYKVCDKGSPAKCDTATQEVTIYPTGSANSTLAVDDYVTTKGTTPATGNVLTNDTDPQGNTLTATAQNITIAGKGTFVLNANGTYTFTAVQNFYGPVSIPYNMCDNGIPQACSQATLYILVEDAGLTLPDVNTTVVNVIVHGDVSTNDQLPAGMLYSNPQASAGNPAGGIITMNSDGTYEFESPNPGVYRYEVDICTPTPNVTCRKELLTITVLDPVTDGNEPATNPDFEIMKGDPVSPATIEIDVRVNDYVTNVYLGNYGSIGTPSLAVATSYKGGTITVNGSGNVEYTPLAGFYGKDTFVYNVCETPGDTLCKNEFVYITVLEPSSPDMIMGTDDYNWGYQGSTISQPIDTGLLINDKTTSGLPLNASVIPAVSTQAGVGTLVLNANGSYTFTPDPTFVGTAVFPYTLTDGNISAQATLYILILDITILPVHFTNLSATCETDKVVVKWQTTQETNNSHFEILKHKNNEWVKVGTIKANGHSYGISSYQFIDVKNNETVNIYKIKQVDFNGQSELSQPILAVCNEVSVSGNQITIYPNPTTDKVNIVSETESISNVEVLDINGKVLIKTMSDSMILEIDLSDLVPGMYFIKVNEKVFKLIKE